MKSEQPIKILLVEDNPGDARLVEELLAEGHAGPTAVTHVDRSAAAMDRLASEPFDLILLDMSMPDSQWLGTFAQMHAAAPNVPVVVLTGIDDSVLALRSIREGAQDYLVKGDVTPTQLGRAIRFALDRHRVSQNRGAAREREHLGAIFAMMESAVIVADEQWRITMANPTACRALGLSGDGVGMPLGKLLDDHLPSVSSARLAENQEPSTELTLAASGQSVRTKARLVRLLNPLRELSSIILLVG